MSVKPAVYRVDKVDELWVCGGGGSVSLNFLSPTIESVVKNLNFPFKALKGDCHGQKKTQKRFPVAKKYEGSKWKLEDTKSSYLMPFLSTTDDYTTEEQSLPLCLNSTTYTI